MDLKENKVFLNKSTIIIAPHKFVSMVQIHAYVIFFYISYTIINNLACPK